MDLPGNQTVTFVAVTNGTEDRNNIATPVEVETALGGCMFRPLSAAEKAGLMDIATEVWKCTAPPSEPALSTNVNALLRYQGKTYTVTAGAQHEYDLDGFLDHVTILCQKTV